MNRLQAILNPHNIPNFTELSTQLTEIWNNREHSEWKNEGFHIQNLAENQFNHLQKVQLTFDFSKCVEKSSQDREEADINVATMGDG